MRTHSESVQPLIENILAYAHKTGKTNQSSPTEVDGLGLVTSTHPSSMETLLLVPMACFVLQGKKVTTIGDCSVSYGAGESLIVSIDTPAIAQITEATPEKPYVVLAMEIDINIVKSLIQEVEYSGNEMNFASDAFPISAGTYDAQLLDAVGRLFSLVDETPTARKVLTPILMREIHFRLLYQGHAGMLRGLGRSNSHASHINRVLLKLKESYADNVTMAELADLAGMSLSGFHTHFKAITGTTPLQYQKDLRLLQARDKLVNSANAVSAVAYEVGYDSVSQFSREYQRKFGNPPSRDRQMMG